jgi:site-specific DNA-methyltransferase (adenine-specific)
MNKETSKTQLYQGDCLEVMKSIPDGSVDMVLMDPPYGTTACKWDSVIPLESMWEQLKRIIKPNGAIVMTASQPFTTTLIASNMKMFKYCWVWEKTMATGGLLAKSRPMKAHEDISVFYNKQPTYNQQRGDGEAYSRKEGVKKGSVIGDKEGGYVTKSNGGRCPRSVVKIANPNAGSLHPTQKPVALMEYLIKTYTNEGETVLDFTMGSGTTGVACVNTGRKFIGIELDEDYFEIAKSRINPPTKKPPKPIRRIIR